MQYRIGVVSTCKQWLCLILLSVVSGLGYAQQVTHNVYSVGDKFDLSECTVLAKGSQRIKAGGLHAEDLKDKVVILDFWATWCQPCQPSLIRLHQLQKEIGADKVMVIAVADEQVEDIYRTIRHMDLPGVYFSNDAQLWHHFEFKIIPHTVVINGKGIIQGITSPENITADRLKKVLEDKTVTFPLKADRKLNLYGPEGQTGNAIFDVSLTGKDSNTNTRIQRFNTIEGIQLIFTNFSIPSMYREVYKMPSDLWVMDQSGDTSRKQYCLSVKLPPGHTEEEAYSLAQRALMGSFPFKARLVKRNKTVYSLVYTPGQHHLDLINQTAGSNRQSEFTAYGPNLIGKNLTIGELMSYLSNEIGSTQRKLVVDGTGIHQRFDITLKWSYADPASLEEALEKYGLSLVEKEAEVDLLLIE